MTHSSLKTEQNTKRQCFILKKLDKHFYGEFDPGSG